MAIYSYSSLTCFEQCQRKYKFQYVDKIRVEIKESIELFLGKRVHEVLKKLYGDLCYQKENTLNEILDFLHHIWIKNWNDSIVILKKERDPEYYLKIAKKYINDYYNKYYPFDEEKTIAVEKRISVNFNKIGDYKLFGYIDRVTKTKNGCYEIHDYKTTSMLPTLECIQNDRQLSLYAIMLRKRYSYIKDVRLVWHYLKFNIEFDSTRSNKELEELKENIIRLIDTIESTEVFSKNPSRLCEWCKFRSICY